MSSIRLSPFITFLSLWVLLISPSPTHSQTCKTQKFTNNQLYTHCLDLPSLSSYLHFTYDSQNKTLSVVFLASPPSSGGWISWGINPTALKMAGSRALVAYKDSKGTVAVNTYNISGYTPDAVTKTKKLDFDVWDTRAEEVSGVMRIYAKVKLTEEVAGKGRVNQVWQVGPGVGGDGVLTPHAMNPPNFNSVGSLDLNGGSGSVGGGGSGANSRLKKRNIHGILNAVSWGILFPIGAIVARYLRTFPSADPAWFYLHASCQVSAYAIGVAGWATGLKLGSESKGIQFTDHRNIGIALFAIATLQIFALFLRPKKDHKYRFYWNIYHHSVGYAILVLGILNVFKGLRILSPEHKWKLAYIIVIGVLGGIAVLLEAITWIVVLTRKSDKSTKPYDGYNNGQGRQQPLAP